MGTTFRGRLAAAPLTLAEELDRSMRGEPFRGRLAAAPLTRKAGAGIAGHLILSAAVWPRPH